MKTHISVRDLNVSYTNTPILKNISIDIPDKKITAIIGPSGCGKTTLLKSLNRLLDLQEGMKVTGEVLVDGENIYDPKAEITRLRKRMGLLSQRPTVLPMSIYENVVYGLRVHGENDKKKLDEAVERYLKEANLWMEVKDRLQASASRLSIGQQQRLCLARGLAVEPEIILGDEPTSALDPQSAEQIEQRFLALKDKYTIVLVTHILRQAKRLADYVIFLYLGDLIEHGPAEEVLNSPKYLKTQAYISGKFIEEPSIYKQLDFKVLPYIKRVELLKVELQGLEVGKNLRILIDSEIEALELMKGVESLGDKVLEIKRVTLKTWEMIVQKQEGAYTI